MRFPDPSTAALSQVLSPRRVQEGGSVWCETSHRSQPSSQGLLGTEGRLGRNRADPSGPKPLAGWRLTHHPCPLGLRSPPTLAEALQLWPRALPNPGPSAPCPLLCRPSCLLCAHSQAVPPSSSQRPGPTPSRATAEALRCPSSLAASESIPGATLQRDREGGPPGTPPPSGRLLLSMETLGLLKGAGWDRALWEIWGNWVYRESKEGRA